MLLPLVNNVQCLTTIERFVTQYPTRQSLSTENPLSFDVSYAARASR